MSIKKSILLFADWYEPGFKAGGPIRSCVNFVEAMKNDFTIYVFTSDRDLYSENPYPDVEKNRWIKDMSVNLFYCSPQEISWKKIHQQIKKISPDFIYLNSMFSKFFSLYPLMICRWYNIPSKIVLAPRGMLRKSALAFKPFKKKVFLFLFRSFNISERIFFQATDQAEMKDIVSIFGPPVKADLIPNLPGAQPDHLPYLIKIPGELSIIFVGRIHPIKNLLFLIDCLQKISGNICLTIMGSIEDGSYWNICKQKILHLPHNIRVNFMGELPNAQLPSVLEKNHIFSLPTLGENFGHAILEALSLGRPVLISNQTPWQGLISQKAGWDISLDNQEGFCDAIRQASSWSQQEYNEWSRNAFDFARRSINMDSLKEKYLQVFT